MKSYKFPPFFIGGPTIVQNTNISGLKVSKLPFPYALDIKIESISNQVAKLALYKAGM